MNTKDDFGLLKLIRKLEIFRDLDVDEGKHILSLCARASYRSGEVAWQVGEDSSHILVLLTGRLRVVDEKGEQTGQVMPGSSFGEMGVITGHKRFAGIVAIEPSTTLCLSRRNLRGLIDSQPKIYIKILEAAVDVLSHRLTETEHHCHEH